MIPHLSPAACEPHRPGSCPGSCTQRSCAPYELPQRASFWVAAGAGVIALLSVITVPLVAMTRADSFRKEDEAP